MDDERLALVRNVLKGIISLKQLSQEGATARERPISGEWISKLSHLAGGSSTVDVDAGVLRAHAEPCANAVEDAVARQNVIKSQLQDDLCSLLLAVPPNKIVDVQSSGFKRLKLVVKERIAWRNWLQGRKEAALLGQSSAACYAVEEGLKGGVEGPSDEASGIVGKLDAVFLETIDAPCAICNLSVNAFSEVLNCDGCQRPHHLSCLQATPESMKSSFAVKGDDRYTLIPGMAAALSVEQPESLPVRLLPTGDWYCGNCHEKAPPSLYGRVQPKKGRDFPRRFQSLRSSILVTEKGGPGTAKEADRKHCLEFAAGSRIQQDFVLALAHPGAYKKAQRHPEDSECGGQDSNQEDGDWTILTD